MRREGRAVDSRLHCRHSAQLSSRHERIDIDAVAELRDNGGHRADIAETEDAYPDDYTASK
jgi:hypothetical protein